jgi:excisionase family DNA binding protein
LGVSETHENKAGIIRPTLTPAEVAKILRIHPVYCRRLFTKGKIPGAIRVGSAWRLPAPALDQILETGLKTGGAK